MAVSRKDAERLLQEKSDSIPQSQYPGLRTIVSEAAQKGSVNFLRLDRTEEQNREAEKVADLLVNGGFVAIPDLPEGHGIERGMWYRDASILPLSTRPNEAKRAASNLPQKVMEIGAFTRMGDRSTTSDEDHRLFDQLDIVEKSLPTIPYDMVTSHIVGSGRSKHEEFVKHSFKYHIFYIPPGSERELRLQKDVLTFRNSDIDTSQQVLTAIRGAVGRELTGRAVGAVRQPYFPLFPDGRTPDNPKTQVSRDYNARQRGYQHDADEKVHSQLGNEYRAASTILEPLLTDIIAIGKPGILRRGR